LSPATSCWSASSPASFRSTESGNEPRRRLRAATQSVRPGALRDEFEQRRKSLEQAPHRRRRVIR
jgi:hypothetical protein